MDGRTLEDWLDRHHVDVVRTFATTLGGTGVGKYVHRRKFLRTLPLGHPVTDIEAGLCMRPDLTTLISDGTDTNLGHCMCDFINADGTPFALCSRSTLRAMVEALAARGYAAKVAFGLEFRLYNDSFEALRRKNYVGADLLKSSTHHTTYALRTAYPASRYMGEVLGRLEWKGIEWEGWNDAAGIGQFELSLEPAAPLVAADTVMRTRQIMHEVARDMDMAVTFMAAPTGNTGSGLPVNLSLTDENGAAVFHDPASPGGQSPLMDQWITGQLRTMPAAVSLLCPSINSYRRLRADFESLDATLHTRSGSPETTRIKHHVAAADANPYLTLATLIAGGLVGMDASTSPGPPRSLPDTISTACEALNADRYLRRQLGDELIDGWLKTRQEEERLFHAESGEAGSSAVSSWEYERYFEVI